MNFNLFIFYTKRQRILKLIRQHYINAEKEFETSKRYWNWNLREERLKQLAKKLFISEVKIGEVWLETAEERRIYSIKKYLE